MLKSLIRIRIELRVGNTNTFKELIRIHVFPHLFRKIKIKYKEKEVEKSEIVTRTEFSKKISTFVLKYINKYQF